MKVVFQSLKERFDVERNREGKKNFRKIGLANSYLNITDQCFWRDKFSRYAVLFSFSIFIMFLMIRKTYRGRWLWMITGFNEYPWDFLKELLRKCWCYLVIIQVRICSWHFVLCKQVEGTVVIFWGSVDMNWNLSKTVALTIQ